MPVTKIETLSKLKLNLKEAILILYPASESAYVPIFTIPHQTFKFLLR